MVCFISVCISFPFSWPFSCFRGFASGSLRCRCLFLVLLFIHVVVCLYWFVRALAYIRSMVRLFVSFTCVILRLVSVPPVELFYRVESFRVVYRSVVSCRLRFLCRLQPKATSNLYVDVRRRGTFFKQLFPEGSTSLPGGNQVDGLPPASS